MRIVVVGVNHTSAPLGLRERLTIPSGEISSALALLRPLVREGFIISTCNRTEVYGVMGHAASGSDVLLRILAERSGLEPAALRGGCYVHVDRDAVRHALRVASGLDSMVLGEDQVLGQMKRALAMAREARLLGATFERMGAAALACGKRVRTFTGVGRHAVSLESLAVRSAVERLGHIEGRVVVVLGAGESARLVAQHLGELRETHVRIVSRSYTRAAALASRVGGEARRLVELPRLLVEADVVFGCTSSAKPLITRAHLERRRTDRAGASLLCVDLGMPRDVEDSVTEVRGVSVLTLDELSQLAESHRTERREHIPAAEAIVNAEADRFLEWLDARGLAHTITLLNAHADAIAQAEIERLLPRLRSMDRQQQEMLAELAHRIVRKLLHRPINTMKKHPEAENMALVMETLFGLRGAGDALDASVPSRPALEVEAKVS